MPGWAPAVAVPARSSIVLAGSCPADLAFAPASNHRGRTAAGWHRHVTLVTAAHPFITTLRLDPKADAPARPSTRSSASYN
ncbi:hypothetical protein GCM10010532_111070 [Dactylosporangium siamense]|uniref:Uncharacterized protein n=1 Tax=Dactylosporangium siamense TaxID=685454 RepID=A0A919UET9_9ACTN|nr:hypothetical protein Dsi01nite_109880 [Dactylosporangium siamense]